MTALDLYRFVVENNIEWSEQANEYGNPDILMLLTHYEISPFYAMMGSWGIFDDGGVVVHWKGQYIAVWMVDFCEHYGINAFEVFKKGESRD
jgi:uncharacterized protein with von Willebrand factor type A (vWA) domain